VLISSHILSEIAQTCDRILVIHRGRLVAEGSEKELGNALGEGTRLTLMLRGRTGAVEEALAKSDLVEGYEVADKSDGLVEAHVTLVGDVREKLVADLVGAGIGVRAVQDAVSELEQIFLELTRRGGTRAALESKRVPIQAEAQA
jgi:ABC-2 type transport system ATP-binding protein